MACLTNPMTVHKIYRHAAVVTHKKLNISAHAPLVPQETVCSSRPRLRSLYRKRMVISEKQNISVETALISGVIPCLSRDHISSGSVFCLPTRKNVTAISSIDSVKTNNIAATTDNLMLGSVTRQNVLHSPAPKSRDAS